MTIVFLITSISLGIGSLVVGYWQAGLIVPVQWFLVLGLGWLGTHWRKWYWFSSVALTLIVIAAGYGIWLRLPSWLMLVGVLGGLLGWDLADLSRRLSLAAPTDDIRTLERSHLIRVGVIAAIGAGLGILSLVVQIQGMTFELAVGLIVLAAFGMTRLVMMLRKY